MPSYTADNSLVSGIPDVGLNAYPAFSDLDADGDFDMMLGRDLQTMLYYNKYRFQNGACVDIDRQCCFTFGDDDILEDPCIR